MPLDDYQPPHMEIHQVLSTESSSIEPEQPACVLGIPYLLSRYGEETLPTFTFDAAGQLLGWKYVDADGAIQTLPATYTPDQAGARVFAKDLRATLVSFVAGDNKIYLNALDTPNIIRIDGNHFVGSSLPATFRTRPMAVGDEVDIDDGSIVRSRKIVSFIGTDIAASYGSNTDKDDTLAAGDTGNPITDTADTAEVLQAPGAFTVTVVQTSLNLNVRGSSQYLRKASEEFTITATEGGVPGNGVGSATFSITSKSGLYAATGVKSTDSAGAYLINDSELAGATVTLDDAAVTVGQVFKVRVYQSYTRLTPDTQIVLADGGSGYTGSSDTTYIIRVIQGSTGDSATGAKVHISDTAGLELVQSSVTLTEDTAVALGTLGLTVKFVMGGTTLPQKGLRAGDVYYVHAAAPSQSAVNFDKAVLNGPAVDTGTFVSAATALGASFKLRYTGEIASDAASDGTAWTVGDDGITLDAALSLYVSTRSNGYQWVAYDDDQGTLSVSFRAAVPVTQNDGLSSVATTTEIATKTGPIALQNTLAFGLNEALAAAGGRRVYYCPVADDTVEAYTAALRKLEATDAIYTLVPLSENADVHDLVRTHVLAMSEPRRQKFRQAFIAIPSPGAYAVLSLAADNTTYLATITDYAGSNRLVTMSEAADGVDFDSLAIGAGDLVKVTSTGETFTIDSVLNANQLLLVSGPAAPVSPAQAFQVWRADTADSQADYLIAAADALKSRRITPIWYEDGTASIGGVSTVIPPMFGAAYMAGLRSSLPPQIGLSRQEVTTITAAPAMYNKYGYDDLNRIAANGMTIFAQDIEGGPVYIRHQLTSDTDNGSLYAESNVTAVVDYVSYIFRARFINVVGKKPASRRNIANHYNDAATVLDGLKQAELESEYGPVIEDWANLSVLRHPTIRDRVQMSVDISIALPTNTFVITINGYVDLPAAA